MRRALDTWPVWLLTLLALGACLTAFVLFLWAGTAWELQWTQGRAFAYVRQSIVIIAAVCASTLFAALVIVGFQDRRTEDGLSPLYWPLVLNAKALATLLVTLSINAFDLLVHNLTPTWMVARQPAVLLFVNLLLLTVVGTKVWTAYLVMRGRGSRALALVTVFAIEGALTAVVVAGAIGWE